MQPIITKSLRRAVEIPCMIICSGTSRLVVIRGEALPDEGEQRNDLLLGLMLGQPHGLGGESSQSNKVVVVTSYPQRETFHFHFYQIIHQTGQMMDKMECSNAAAAAGLFARLSRIAVPMTGQSVIHTTNTATGQKITLSIPAEEEIWKYPWGVRFDLSPAVTDEVRSYADVHEAVVDGKTIRYHIVPRGNLFVFCQISPRLMTPQLSKDIARQASEVAIELGRATRPFLPKIIPYHILDGTHVEAASFFEGERHASMPGSASMALGLFLSLARGAELVGQNLAQPSFEVIFQGGSMRVDIGMEEGVARYTEFYTPVRLLLHGAAPVPPGHSFLLEIEEPATA